MQRVDGNQQWGAWGAGPAMAPGTRTGGRTGRLVTISVGFVGPKTALHACHHEFLDGKGGYDDGVQNHHPAGADPARHTLTQRGSGAGPLDVDDHAEKFDQRLRDDDGRGVMP